MSQENPNSRLEAFCDAIIAIAITLLILEIKVPHISEIHSVKDLYFALEHQWTFWVAFLLSFGTILVAWVNHHRMFKYINKTSGAFLWGNGFWLLTISILPFPTALMAEYLNTPYFQPAISFYCFCAFLHNIGWNVLMETMLRPLNLAKNETALSVILDGRKFCRIGFFINGSVFALSFYYPMTAMLATIFLWGFWIFVGIFLSGGDAVYNQVE